MPSRRSFLALTGIAALGGCAGVSPPTKPPRVTVESVTVESSALDFSVAVAEQFTTESPARLRIDAENTTGEMREFGFPPSGPYPVDSARSERGGNDLLLADPDLLDRFESSDLHAGGPCWSHPGTQIRWLPLTTISMRPGESVVSTYPLLAPHDGCLSDGTYTFEEAFDWTSATTRVSFTLSIENAPR